MKITVNGKEVEATELHFETGVEEWNEYKLLDGGVVKVKTVVTKIFKVDGQEEAYAIRTRNIVDYRSGT